MPNYAIIRVHKHTSLGTIGGIGHHLDRTRETPNADPAKAHLNRTWDGQQWVQWGDVPRVPGSHLDAYRERLRDFKQRGGTIQKNAVLALEVLMTASPQAFTDPQFDFEGWLQAQHDYLVKRFGAQNIISVVLHLDEETPHVHAIVIPEIQRIERRGNKKTTKPQVPKAPKPALAASQWVGGRALLRELQDDYAGDMARFGLERGKERSGARHTPVSEYYAQGAALVARVEQLQDRVAELEPQAERLPQVEQQLAEARARIDSLQASRADLRARLDRLRAARDADAADLDVIRAIKETMPATYERMARLAAEQLDARAAAMIASMQQEPDTDPAPGL